MPTHKFQVGERVQLRQKHLTNAPRGPYEIVRLLPSDDGVPVYRIKNQGEGNERVAKEIELTHYT